MKKAIFTTLLTTGLLTSTAAFADGHQKGHDFGKGHYGSKIYRKLDLSDAQKSQVRDIMQASKGDRQGKYHNMMNQVKARQTLIESPTLDEAALNQMADTMASKVKQRFIARTKAEHQIWQILTPEQREKAKKLQAKRAEKMQKRMEKHNKRKEQSDG